MVYFTRDFIIMVVWEQARGCSWTAGPTFPWAFIAGLPAWGLGNPLGLLWGWPELFGNLLFRRSRDPSPPPPPPYPMHCIVLSHSAVALIESNLRSHLISCYGQKDFFQAPLMICYWLVILLRLQYTTVVHLHKFVFPPTSHLHESDKTFVGSIRILGHLD